MDRAIRNSVHSTQKRTQIKPGIPNILELKEAVPVLRSVPGIGIVEYIRYKGQLYSSAYSSSEPILANTPDNISYLHNGTTGDYDWQGSISNTIDNNTADVKVDLAALASKVNEIIRALRKAHLIGSDGKFGDTKGA